MTKIERTNEFNLPEPKIRKKNELLEINNESIVSSLAQSDKNNLSTPANNSAKTNISFLGEDLTTFTSSVEVVLNDFAKDLNLFLSSTDGSFPPAAAKAIQNHQEKIKKILEKGDFDSVGELKKVNDQFLSLIRVLTATGMVNPELKKGMDRVAISLMEKYGKDFSLPMKATTVAGVVTGIETVNSGKLSNEQKKVLKETQFLFKELESIKALKNPLTFSSMALLSMRQALLTMSMDLLSLPDPKMLPELKYQKFEFIANALKMTDEMLKSGRNISPTLIADFEKSIAEMLGAADGKIATAMSQYPDESVFAPVKEAGEQIKEGKNDLDPLKQNLENIGENSKKSVDSKQIQDSLSGITGGTSFIKDLLANAPFDLSKQVGEMIDSYTESMNSVESSIPILPFPLSLPIPLAYDDGKGTSFMIPAGAKITSNSTGISIESNGIGMTSGDNIISSGNAIIKLGKNDVDHLGFASLKVKNGESESNFTGFDAIINRNNGTAIIKADSAVIDLGNGTAELTNTRLTRNENGAVKVNSDNFLYQGDDGTSASFDAFEIQQNTLDGVSTLNGSAGNINITTAESVITADSMSFALVNNENNGNQSALINATNVNYQSAGGNLAAGSATISYLHNDSGSVTSFQTENAAWTSEDTQIKLDGNTNISFSQSPDGTMTNLNAHADSINYSGSNGTLVAVTNSNFNIDYNQNGTVSGISASADNLNYTDNSGNLNASGSSLNLLYDENGQISQISGNVQNLGYISAQGDQLNATNGSLNVNYGENGNLSSLTGSVDSLGWTGQNGDTVNASGLNVALNYNDQGTLQTASAAVGNVNYTSATGDNINVVNGSLNVNYGENGNLSSLTGSADSLGWTGQNGDTVNASGLNVALNYNDQGTLQTASATVGNVNYTSAAGDNVNVANGNVNFNYDDQGQLEGISGSIEKIDWSGKNGDQLTASGTAVALNYGDNGLLENVSASVGSVNYLSSKGDKVDLTNGAVNLNYNEAGNLTTATGSAESVIWTGKEGNTLTASGVNIALNTIDPNNPTLNAAVQNLNYVQIDGGDSNMTVNVNNATLSADNKQISVHVDSAQFIETMTKDLKEKYNVTVENVDLVISKNETGGLASADLQIGSATAAIDEMNIMVKTQNGDRVRLNVALSEDGTYITEAFLQIPAGGEIKVEGKDYNVTLGEDQKITFTQDGKGLYTLRDDNINIDANFKDTKVKVEGGSAQVSMDTTNGNILIDEITGTNITVEMKDGQKIDIDLNKIKDFIFQGGTYDDGSTKGFMINLKPTNDQSSMTMEVKTEVEGIPISVEFDNIHDFEASGYYTTNLAHIYVGDKSGQGEVEINAGPLKLSGSAVEFVARYNTFDAQRMLTSVNKLLTNEGVYLGKGLSFEADGVIRLGTQFNGPHAEIALMLPHNYQNPYNMKENTLQDDSWGLVASLGWKAETKKGTKVTTDLNAGLIPGSYISLNQTMGQTSLYGIPLTRNNALPTTAMGGITVRTETEKLKISTSVGAYFNPASLIKEGGSIPISENNMYGGFAGVSVSSGDSTYNLQGMVGIDQNKKPDPGFRMGFSTRFSNSELFPKKD